MRSKLELADTESQVVSAILAWPNEAVPAIRREVLGRLAGAPVDGDALREFGLSEAGSSWTELGRSVSDLLVHESWLAGDEVQGLLYGHIDLTGASILDVGCSTAWTLRQMRHAGWRIGVDIDQEALALGHRLAEAEGQAVEFRHASAHQLPFADGAFDCVLCRNALTYMHQRQAMQEMARVLRPGGVLLLRYEAPIYDIQQILRAVRSPKALVCRARDFAFGMVHAAMGWQPQPGTRLSPGRIYGSTRRLRSYLQANGCEVKDLVDARKCPRFFGRANQKSMLAFKQQVAVEQREATLLATIAICAEVLVQAA